MAEKRQRRPNWLIAEKNLLLNIVQKHLFVIENNKLDTATLRKKAREWIIISDEYNAQTLHAHRTAENLKSQWKSMKKAVKKNNRLHQTGEGSPGLKKDLLSKRIQGLISLQSQFDNDPLDNEAGSEYIVPVEDDSKMIDPQDIKHEVPEVEPDVPVTTSVPVAKQEPDSDHRSIKCIQPREPELPVSAAESFHCKKMEAIEIQYKHAKEEREEAKSLHKINMLIKQQELNIKKEEFKQNKIKTRLLMLELILKRKEVNK